jgi:hypothetical protein
MATAPAAPPDEEPVAILMSPTLPDTEDPLAVVIAPDAALLDDET